MADLSLSSGNRATVQAYAAADPILRGALFIATLLVVWITVHPFQDRADPAMLHPDESGDAVNQAAYLILFAAHGAYALCSYGRRLTALLRPALLVTLAWFAVTVVTSWDPGLSARRLVFTVMVMAIAASTLLLPKNLRQFSGWLAVTTLVALALCYAGVLLAPQLSIHQVSDVLEPEHVGSWRGAFSHKNEAGAALVGMIFIGMFVGRVQSRALGWSIVVLASIFLIFSHAKSSIGLLPFVLAMAALIVRIPSRTARIAIVVGTVAVLNIIPIASAYSATVREALESVIGDATFTGRTDIWQFGLESLAKRPITGYGYSAFWGTEQVVYGFNEDSTWATDAADAHNAYLNVATGTGVPGLALVLFLIVVLPMVDFQKRAQDADSHALTLLFLRVWLFGIYVSSFESVIFPEVSRSELWFMILLAVFGMRFLTLSPVEP
jgi:O-antigen ligase